jgi:hypothetical protein
MPKKKYYVLSNGKLHEEVKNKMFTTYKSIELPEVQDLTPEWHGKKIPLSMWQEILAFMQHSYNELKSETMCFLYYDESKDQPWSFWVPPQITAGMTVKSDPDHINFQAQRAQHPDIMFGTVHHHCSTSAFQSGTDEADETNREGFHFTIGNLNKTDIDIHFRWCLNDECHEIEDLSMVIDGAESPFRDDIELTDAMAELEIVYMNEQFYVMPDLKQYDFTAYMDNVSKQTYVPRLGKGYGKGYQSALFPSEKKTSSIPGIAETMIESGDVIDEILFNLAYQPDTEVIVEEYLHSKNVSPIDIQTQTDYYGDCYGTTIQTMCNDESFIYTTNGKYFTEQIKEFLVEYQWSIQQFRKELDKFVEDVQSFDNDERIGF